LYNQSKNDNKKNENSQATYVCLLAACMWVLDKELEERIELSYTAHNS
jgi:hypothetical protein